MRPGVLPRLLNEILTTRIMVKQAMKRAGPAQRVLQRIQNARQFALKLIANVTYGYTAAGFSGRMPCAELADSIVQCGRYTLERAIEMVEANPRWGARVVYGDTDRCGPRGSEVLVFYEVLKSLGSVCLLGVSSA